MITYRRRYITIKGKPPCCGVYEYSIDGGMTWMDQKEWNELVKSLLIEEKIR